MPPLEVSGIWLCWFIHFFCAIFCSKYVILASFWFLILIILEAVFAQLAGKNVHRINDCVTSYSIGAVSVVVKFIVKDFEISLYEWAYRRFAIVYFDPTSHITWIFSFFLVDLLYYCIHRAGHEVNILWAVHQVHHSSEDYNLTTALRQGFLQSLLYSIFYIPLSTFLPPSTYITHIHLNLLYQFWIHTQLIGSLSILDYIMNTPAHHRIHHGRNRFCIDKNYAGVLIIWDRIFGTFRDNKKNEPISYGLVQNVNSFEIMYCNFVYWKRGLFDKITSLQTVGDKVKAVFYGPGWSSGKPRLGDLADIPEIVDSDKKYDPTVPQFLKVYFLMDCAVTTVLYFALELHCKNIWSVGAFPDIIYLIMSFTSICVFYDKRNYFDIINVMRIVWWYFWIRPLFINENDFYAINCCRIYFSLLSLFYTYRIGKLLGNSSNKFHFSNR